MERTPHPGLRRLTGVAGGHDWVGGTVVVAVENRAGLLDGLQISGVQRCHIGDKNHP